MFGEAVGSEVVQLACDLLVDGIEIPAAVDLGPPPFSVTMTDAEPFFREAITELGRPPAFVELLAAAVHPPKVSKSTHGLVSDPAGRRVRWWDGTSWTDHVADGASDS